MDMARAIHLAEGMAHHHMEIDDCASIVGLAGDSAAVAALELQGERLIAHWGADNAEHLADVLREAVRMTGREETPVYMEWVPDSFTGVLQTVGLNEYSHWRDFWIRDLELVPIERPAWEIIREAGPEDYAAAAKVTRDCRMQSRGFEGEDEAFFQVWMAESPAVVLVAEYDSLLIGTACLSIYGFDSEKGPVCWLRELAVSPAFQGRGIGRALVMAGIEWGKARGARRSFLAADRLNERAIRLYTGIGYRLNEDDPGQRNLLGIVRAK